MSARRGANMTAFEDEVLCRSYIGISVDSVQGANQTNERLWEAISIKYHEQPGVLIPRSISSLQSRFQAISTSVMYFVAKLAHAMNNAASGTNEMDWVNEARAAYLNDKKKPFNLDNCYQILKDHQRFSLTTTSSNTQRSHYGPIDSVGSSINIGDDSSPINIEGPDLNRPTGRNEAKLERKRKGKAKSLASHEAAVQKAAEFNKIYEEKATANEKKHEDLRIQMERLANFREEERERNNREEVRWMQELERLEENTLMSMDLTRMNEQQKALYNYRLQNFLNRRRQNEQASHNYSANQYL